MGHSGASSEQPDQSAVPIDDASDVLGKFVGIVFDEARHGDYRVE